MVSSERLPLDDDLYTALLITLVSGLSTGLGGLIVLSSRVVELKNMGRMLSFAAGVMLYISFADLLTDAVEEIGFPAANIWMFLGMLLFAGIVKFIPEPDLMMNTEDSTTISQSSSAKGDGVKTRHGSQIRRRRGKKEGDTSNNRAVPIQEKTHLWMTGIVTALGISLHNFPEGMAVYLTCLKGLQVGVPLAFAIALHNIPEGMAVALPIYASTNSKYEAFKWTLVSGLCEPVGALLVGTLFYKTMTVYAINCMLAGVAGIMIFLCIHELYPTTLKYCSPEVCSLWNIVGMFTIFVSLYFMRMFGGHSLAPHGEI